MKRMSAAEESAGEAVERLGAEKVRKDHHAVVESFFWSMVASQRVAVGDIVLLRWRDKEAHADELLPPGKVLAIRKVRGKQKVAISYASRKWARVRDMRKANSWGGAWARKALDSGGRMRQVKGEARTKLLRLWSVSPDS
jgi:hypothetical protein